MKKSLLHRLAVTAFFSQYIKTERERSRSELNVAAGTNSLPSMDPLGAEDGAAGREDHQEDNYDAEQDEGAGPQREILQVTSCQCS